MAVSFEGKSHAPGEGYTTGRYAYSDYGSPSNEWMAGDVAFYQRVFVSNPDTLQIASCKFVLDGVETGVASQSALGSGNWQISFSYPNNPDWAGLDDGSHTWALKLVTSVDTYYSDTRTWTVAHFTGELSKPTTPTPANGSGPGINFTNRTVSWVNGGGAETYTVRMGSGGTPINVVSLSQTGTSYTIPEADIYRYKGNIISWRVDAEAGGETVRGDVWTFDPRPAKATTPSPADDATNTALNLTTLSWTKDAYTDKSSVFCGWAVGFGIATAGNSLTLASYTPLYMDRLGYSNTYTWRVDTTNEFGTTDGDTWSFSTIPMARTVCSWENYDGKTKGPGVENGGGVEGVDYYWTGDNCISTVKRVVAFAADRVWITEV